MLMVVPKCECGQDARHYVPRDEKTWFDLWMCPDCLTVLQCMIRGTTDRELMKNWETHAGRGRD